MDNINQKLNRGVEEIKKISMTMDEKKRMLENIMNSTVSPYQPTPSPFGFSSFVSILHKRRVIQYVAIPCLIIVLAGGGVGVASSSSLPGGTLYGVKTNMVEPLNSFFKFSPEARAKYEVSLAAERLMEAETLATNGELDDSKEETISGLLEYHTDALNGYRGKFQKSEKSEKEDEEIVAGFENKVNEHVQNLDRIRNKEKKENEIEKNETKINKAARASVQKVKEAKAPKEQKNGDKHP